MNKLRAVLARRWPIIVATTVLGLVIGAFSGALASSDVVPMYTVAQTLVANRNSSGYGVPLPQDVLRVTRGEVPTMAAEALGRPDDATSLAKRIEATFDDKSSSIRIASTSEDPKEAEALVVAFTDAFMNMASATAQSDLRQQLSDNETDLAGATDALAAFDERNPSIAQLSGFNPSQLGEIEAALLQQRSELVSNIEQSESQIRDLERQLERSAPYESLGLEPPSLAAGGLLAVPASAPVRAALLGMIGLLLGGVITLTIERTNPRIDIRDELADLVALPILAEVGYLPPTKQPIDGDGRVHLEGPWAEQYRAIRSAVLFAQATARDAGKQEPAVFLVTSPAPAEGKSTTSALLAQALVETGTLTVVVGGDFRKPTLSQLLGIQSTASLHDLARMDEDRLSIDEVVIQSPHQPNLYVAAAGPPTRETASLLGAARDVCTEASRRGATVIVDSSPLKVANDTTDLLPVVDYVIMAVRAGQTTQRGLLESLDTINRHDRPVLGVVFVASRTAGNQQAYYYDYYGSGS